MYVSFHSTVLFLFIYKKTSYQISILLEENRTKVRVKDINIFIL